MSSLQPIDYEAPLIYVCIISEELSIMQDSGNNEDYNGSDLDW